MKAQVKVGRIAGISIGLHYSWFIIALLIALSLAQHFRAVAPQWSGIEVWMAAVITGLLFFATLLLHELAHSLVAKTRGLRVRPARYLKRARWMLPGLMWCDSTSANMPIMP